jgi:uncharacterized membrane protein YfcA
MTLAFLGALIIGVSLGLLGSGGSILTVPVLLFILNRPEKLAITESLAIVGFIAFVGAFPYAMRTHIHWRSVIFFGLPGMLGAYIGARGSYYISDTVQLILFAIVMLTAAGVMFFGPPTFEKFTPPQYSTLILVIQGFIVGSFTGLIGVGGGFLIVPALVFLSNMPMFFAVGTSLVIIAMNSITGFIVQLFSLNAFEMQINWEIIGMISITGILGSFAGSFIANRISQARLRQVFGLSILVMGGYILFREYSQSLH